MIELKFKESATAIKHTNTVRRISFRYLRDLKYISVLAEKTNDKDKASDIRCIATTVIIEMWVNNLVTTNTKDLLMKWLYH